MTFSLDDISKIAEIINEWKCHSSRLETISNPWCVFAFGRNCYCKVLYCLEDHDRKSDDTICVPLTMTYSLAVLMLHNFGIDWLLMWNIWGIIWQLISVIVDTITFVWPSSNSTIRFSLILYQDIEPSLVPSYLVLRM